jgi:UDP-N-acetyl-D-glucosamine/UDP-N-acetyl-D-galactosamine dehydrogenase
MTTPASPRATWRADLSDVRIAVIGLGYVGLPVAVAFAEAAPGTIGFDIDTKKVATLQRGRHPNGEVPAERLVASGLVATADPADLADADTYVVAVPTPVDHDKRPDLRPLLSACATVGPHLRRGDLVVFESTVWPGLTEEVCGPALERASGLRATVDFSLGYSPERINPGDTEHTLEKIVKVVSGDTPEALERVAALYERVVHAGVHRAPSIAVAEAAKVIENTQRDLNIALMNELAVIFERMNLRTADVLAAAGTKWNFLRFTPGLVGGHCIGVDPYYLTTKAEQLGYHPQVILAGRRINDGMAAFIAQKTVKLLIERGISPLGARVRVLGITFKEDVPDLRNSKVPDLVAELRGFGVHVDVVDPVADADEAMHEYGIELADPDVLEPAHAVVLASPHKELVADAGALVFGALADGGIVVDVKARLAADPRVWAL